MGNYRILKFVQCQEDSRILLTLTLGMGIVFYILFTSFSLNKRKSEQTVLHVNNIRFNVLRKFSGLTFLLQYFVSKVSVYVGFCDYTFTKLFKNYPSPETQL